MKASNINTSLLILSILLIIGSGLYLDARIPKVAHVNVTVLYQEFDLKLEMESKLDITRRKRQEILDSLLLKVQWISARIQEENGTKEETVKTFQAQRQYYLTKEQQFKEDNQALADQYTKQIWKQLNQYVKDYGNEHGYTYILGAEGSGAIMAAAGDLDITDDVKFYVNKRYRGVINN